MPDATLGGGGGGSRTGGETTTGTGGNGLVIIRYATLGAIPEMVLNSPDADEQFSTQDITFNCTASDDINLVNVSLLIDGVVNETNSSGLNNTNYIFEKTFSEGKL